MKTRELHIAFLFSLLALPSMASLSAVASDFCEISQVTDSQITDRTRTIKFPDGRTITIVGHNHGDRGFPVELSLLTRATRHEVSDQDFVARIRKLLKNEGKAPKHAEEDLAYLKKQLSTNEGIEFVGIEGTQEAVTENYAWMQGLKHRLTSQISKRNLLPSSDYESSFLLAAGAPMYLSLTNPKLLAKGQLVGLESNSDAHEIALDEFDEARDKLKALAQGDEKFLKAVRETYSDFAQIYSIYDPATHDEMILEAAKKEIPKKYLEAGMHWIRMGLAEMTAMKARDRALADNLMSAKGSGILFIGLLHVESIAKMLQQKCQAQESARPNPTSKSDEPALGVR